MPLTPERIKRTLTENQSSSFLRQLEGLQTSESAKYTKLCVAQNPNLRSKMLNSELQGRKTGNQKFTVADRHCQDPVSAAFIDELARVASDTICPTIQDFLLYRILHYKESSTIRNLLLYGILYYADSSAIQNPLLQKFSITQNPPLHRIFYYTEASIIHNLLLY